ncbi:Epsin-2 [Schistosoma japonicum]|uniref:Epsin-2 n=1 Tax=Schistosoma japonicum TaxID=6182 RepID=A0A4Z2DSA5_SCHJA|nr:Epsin-2 [Schistosoma japonicum]
MPIHRHIKNVVHNYTDSERKVREATSNDPWGPSSTLMAEIADKTHNVMAFTEIMQMIWRRLNDKSKNWRHVYKALVLLDYLTKTGSEKVATQCRENIHSIETLRDFEYVEDGKDRGQTVREKARNLSMLLRDEERLKEERSKALLARDRLMHGGLGSTASVGDSPIKYSISSGRSSYPAGYSGTSFLEKGTLPPKSPVPHSATELESVRPQSAGEEQLHLQLALAISKEEHDREERRRRAEEAKEEAKVQMVLEQSRREEQKDKSIGKHPASNVPSSSSGSLEPPSYNSSGGLFNLVDTSLSAAPAHLPDPWSSPLAAPSILLSNNSNTTASPSPSTSFNNTNALSLQQSSTFPLIPIDDPWSPKSQPNIPPHSTTNNSDAIWSLDSTLGATFPSTSSTNTEPIPSNHHQHHHTVNNGTDSINNGHFDFDLDGISSNNIDNFPQQFQHPSTSHQNAQSPSITEQQQQEQQTVRKRSPSDFLGEHKKLVDLEKLVEKNPASTNPFTVGPKSLTVSASNPFIASQPIKPSLNQLAPTPAALPGPSYHATVNNPLLYPVRPYFPGSAITNVQPNYSMVPVNPNAWPVFDMPSNNIMHQHQQQQQQTSSLNPFY